MADAVHHRDIGGREHVREKSALFHADTVLAGDTAAHASAEAEDFSGGLHDACYAGMAQLDAFLADTDILAVLLPLTPDTRGTINRGLIAKLSRQGRDERLPGPVLINAGRGGLQVDADIFAALEAGQLYAASLDVFEAEPLPHSSPLWAHPRVVVTPHNAAESAPAAIVRYALRQIAAHRNGEALDHVVDPKRGY